MDQLTLGNGQPVQEQSGEVCGYHIGKIAETCKRYGQPYQRHWPELNQLKRAHPMAEVCPVCSYAIDSDQHLNHCRGRA